MQAISITQEEPGKYTWLLSLSNCEPAIAESDAYHHSIEACLRDASKAIANQDPYIQIWYRGFCMGTSRTNKLQTEANTIVERIVASYADLR